MPLDFNKGMGHFSKHFNHQAGASPDFDRSVDRILDLQTDIGIAGDNRLFAPLPTDAEEKPKDWSRIKTIRNRLHCLGYIDKDTGSGHWDDTLKKGIIRFQREAGLKADGWIGEKETWPALQELVSFETPIDINKWFKSSRPRPALRRAISLRLFVLGLKETKPLSAQEDIETGLRAFGDIWEKLAFEKVKRPVGLSPEWILRLFDMDTLTRNLSQASTRLSNHTLKQVHSLIVNAAKIELWLMGYPVKPNGYDLKATNKPLGNSGGLTKRDIFLKSKTLSQNFTVKKSIKFYRGLHAFWIDQGKKDGAADELSVNFLTQFQTFFQVAAEGVTQEKQLNPIEAQEKIEDFMGENRDQLPKVWDNVKRFGARIWDGIRRAWGWFKRMVSGIAKKIKEVGLNMSRIIYDFALGSFTIVANLMKSLSTTVKIMVDPCLPGSNTQHVLFLKDNDLDSKVIVNTASDGKHIRNCCGVLNYELRKFSFGCRVIGTLVAILMEIFKKGWAGYFGLVFALVKLRRLKVRFTSLVDEYRDIFVLL